MALATTSGQPGSPDPGLVLAGTYPIDADHTFVTWAVNRMGFSILEGQFPAASGSITLHPGFGSETMLEVTFDIARLSVGVPALAKRLKSADLFDKNRYPTAHFVSRSFENVLDERASVSGELTLKGVTRQVTLDATFVGAGLSPETGRLNFGFSATAVVMRSEFGLGFMVPTVSDGVRLHVAAAFAATDDKAFGGI